MNFSRTNAVQRKTVAGENIGKFGKFEVIRQSFTHPNLHLKICRNSIMWPIEHADTCNTEIHEEIHPPFEEEMLDPTSPLSEKLPSLW